VWDWQVVASLAAGLAIGATVIGWPRLALICLGLVSLLLGLLGISTLKVMSSPALLAIIGGIGLIGLGSKPDQALEADQQIRFHADFVRHGGSDERAVLAVG
jgi:hypothetical protein